MTLHTPDPTLQSHDSGSDLTSFRSTPTPRVSSPSPDRPGVGTGESGVTRGRLPRGESLDRTGRRERHHRHRKRPEKRQ